MIIGAQKCATSTLAKLLSDHPQLKCSQVKEPHFFSKHSNWKENLDSYHQLFENENEKIWFEASTSYTFYPEFNPNIVSDLKEYNSELKFLYIIRNPFNRIESAYRHLYSRGYVKGSLSETIKNFPNILNVTKYFSQLERYYQFFDKNSIKIISFESFNENRLKSLNEIASFLNVESSFFNEMDLNIQENTKTHQRIDYRLDSLSNNQVRFKNRFPKIWNWYVKKFYVHTLKEEIKLSDSDKKWIKDNLREDIFQLSNLNFDQPLWINEFK